MANDGGGDDGGDDTFATLPSRTRDASEGTSSCFSSSSSSTTLSTAFEPSSSAAAIDGGSIEEESDRGKRKRRRRRSSNDHRSRSVRERRQQQRGGDLLARLLCEGERLSARNRALGEANARLREEVLTLREQARLFLIIIRAASEDCHHHQIQQNGRERH